MVEKAGNRVKNEKINQLLNFDVFKYQVLINHLPQKIFLKDQNSVYVSCNKSYAGDLNIDPENIVGKTDFDFFPKKLADKYRYDDKGVMKRGIIEEFEEEYIQEGERKYVHTIKIPVKNKEDKVIGLFGIFWDVIESKKLFKKLIESEQQLTERIKEISCLYDLSRLGEMKDITLDQLIRNTLILIIAAFQFPYITVAKITYNNKEFKTTDFIDTEWKLTTTFDDNKVKLIIDVCYLKNKAFLTEEQYLIDEIGNRLKDIIEHKISEQRIEKSNSELNQIFNASIPMYITDLDYNVIKVNERFCNLIRRPRSEIIGRKCFNILDGPMCGMETCSLKQILSGREKYQYETKKEFDDGTKVYCIVKNYPFNTKEDGLIGVIKTFTDITERIYTEEKLSESEEKYRLLVNNLTDLVCKLDSEGVILFASPSYCKTFGQTEEEMLGKKFMPLVHEDDLELTLKEMEKLYSPPYSVSIEHRELTRDGWRWLSWVDTAVLDSNNNVKEIIGVGRDITERKKIELKLQESEEKYRDLYEEAPNAYFSVSKEKSIKRCNKAAVNLLGYSKEELLKMKVLDLYAHSPEGVQKAKKTFEKFLRGEKIQDEELQMKKKNGQYIWISLTVKQILDEDGNVIESRSMILDITKRKIAEMKSKASEDKYRNILENIDEGYFEVDLKGNFTFFNKALCDYLGYSSDELQNMNFTKLYSTETASEIFHVYNDLYLKGKGFKLFEAEFLQKNGDKSFHESSIYLRYNPNSEIVGYKGFLRDISERKKVEILREKFNKNLELEVKNRTIDLNKALKQQKLYLDQIIKASNFKSEFLATMSHELRTPLNAIIGFTELLLEGIYGSLNKDQLDFIHDIKESAEHQYEMIKHILDISKIESGQVSVNIEKIELKILIEQIISSLKPLYSEKKINIKIKGFTNKSIIYADRIKFKQIIYNLLSNALKFTEKGIVSLEFIEKFKDWEFHVKDTGIGIDKQDFGIIFKDFKRVKSPYVDSTTGTGLGLALTKRVINLHGGDISFTSKLGKGTTFIFNIPKNFTSKKNKNKIEEFLNTL